MSLPKPPMVETPFLDAPPSGTEGNSLVNNNHVFFYNDITDESVLNLVDKLVTLDEKLQYDNYKLSRQFKEGAPSAPIYLHIQSHGGDTFAALAAASHIQSLSSKVITIVEGIAASGGSILSVAGDVRWMQHSAVMLVHHFSWIIMGNYHQMKDDTKALGIFHDTLVDHYLANSKATSEEITELLSHESWLTPSEAMKFGFVDKVV